MDYIHARLSNIESVNDLKEEIEELKVAKQDKLQQSLTATRTVGGVTTGTTFAPGTSLETIIRAILS